MKGMHLMLGPMQTFDTNPPLQAQFKKGTKAYPLNNVLNSSIVIHLWHPLRKLHKFGRGTVTITDAPSGMFSYQWDRNDTSTEGTWEVWTELRLTTGSLSSTNTNVLEITNRKSGYTKQVVGRMRIV